jgi:hypothetical protein
VPRLARLASAAIAFTVLALLSPGSAEGAWRWPVRGEVVGEFAHSPRTAFAAGQRRGIDIAARPGAVVGAACAGRVTFVGLLPGRGRGVSVRCGALSATHLGLARTFVHPSAAVAAGAALGVVGRRGTVRLGARVATERFGYLDPLELLRREPPPGGGAPVGPAPADGRRAPVPPAAPSPRFSPVRPLGAPVGLAPVPSQAGGREVPVAGWAGLALLAAGLPVGGLVRARRRRRLTRGGLGRVPR